MTFGVECRVKRREKCQNRHEGDPASFREGPGIDNVAIPRTAAWRAAAWVYCRARTQQPTQMREALLASARTRPCMYVLRPGYCIGAVQWRLGCLGPE